MLIQGDSFACVTLCVSSHLSALDLELVVDAGCEVVEDDHLGLGAEPVLLLDPHADQRLDRRGARDAPHRRRAGPHEGVIVQGCKR